MYVLASFDLPICRVALKFKIIGPTQTEERKMEGKCLDVSYINKQNADVTPGRLEKYQARTIHQPKSPGKLSTTVLFMTIYDMLRK